MLKSEISKKFDEFKKIQKIGAYFKFFKNLERLIMNIKKKIEKNFEMSQKKMKKYPKKKIRKNIRKNKKHFFGRHEGLFNPLL